MTTHVAPELLERIGELEAKLAEAQAPDDLGITHTAAMLSARCRELRDRIVKQSAALAAAREQARDHHLRVCESCAVTESDLIAAREQVRVLRELASIYEADPINARDDPRSWQKLSALLAALRSSEEPKA